MNRKTSAAKRSLGRKAACLSITAALAISAFAGTSLLSTAANAVSAEEYGLKDKDVVSVKVGMGTGRETIFNDCVVRVSTKYAPAMHIDTDESNAAGLTGTCDGEILK